jgi:predicted transposase YdaD
MLYGEYDPEVEMRVVREEAMEEEKLIIAKNLLSEGSTPEFVQRITGLSPEEIEEIL